jgi:hypothetical protein
MIQIDMEMPKCCDECFALDDHGDYPFCLISQDQRGYTFNTKEKRMPTCPLKAQEPRVMTVDDVVTLKKDDVIVLEQHEISVIINAIYMQRITREDDDTTYTEAIKVVTAYTDGSAWLNCGTYGKAWRIWTSRPTDAQMEAIPWD